MCQPRGKWVEYRSSIDAGIVRRESLMYIYPIIKQSLIFLLRYADF